MQFNKIIIEIGNLSRYIIDEIYYTLSLLRSGI